MITTISHQIDYTDGLQPKMAYAGLYLHEESGLYLATYRGYNPATARWLNRDPIAELGGLNLYGCVDGKPLSYTDDNGLIVVCDVRLKGCRVMCSRNPILAGACITKCEEQYGALSQCENEKPKIPEKEDCPLEDKKADPNNPECTFEKWRAGKCEK